MLYRIGCVSLLLLAGLCLAPMQAQAICVTQSAPVTYPANFTLADPPCDLVGNQYGTLGTLLAGEDQLNNLSMASGGAVRRTQILGTGGFPSTATDATTTPQILPTGRKTFTGRVTCTGTCVQTQKIYGTWRSTADATLDDLVCTIVLSKATADQASCIPTETNFSYWYVVTTLTGGTTPLAGVFAQY